MKRMVFLNFIFLLVVLLGLGAIGCTKKIGGVMIIKDGAPTAVDYKQDENHTPLILFRTSGKMPRGICNTCDEATVEAGNAYFVDKNGKLAKHSAFDLNKSDSELIKEFNAKYKETSLP